MEQSQQVDYLDAELEAEIQADHHNGSRGC